MIPLTVRRSLLAAALLLVVPLSARGDSLRLDRSAIPVAESIELRIDPARTEYSGKVEIDLDVPRRTDALHFHAEKIGITSMALAGKGTPVELKWTEGEKGLIRAAAPHPIAPGRYRLTVEFSDDFNTDAVGLYRMEKDGVAYAFTQFEADDAREAFPCWDEPGFKLPYRFTLTVPEGDLAVTNTLPESTTVAGGWSTTVFHATKPLPSYLLAIAVGPLETVDVPGCGIPTRIVTVKGQSALAATAVEMTPPLLHALEAYFKSPYPFEKLDLIAVPEYWAGAMENPGAITFSDHILCLDPERVSLAEKRFLARVTAHELAHMWFGDLVTMEWWDDLWLNESFADWMGDKITEQVYPEFEWGLTAIQGIQRTMFDDALPSTLPIRRPVASTESLLEEVGLAYDKGKAVLGMFENWLGPETFRTGILEYLRAHAWGNARAADLWKALDHVSGKKVSESMAGFLEQPGFPLVSLENGPHGTFVLRQRRFHNASARVDPLSWRIPVGLEVSRGGKVRQETLLLTGPSRTVDLGEGVDWVYPNLQARGYYRWSLSPTLWDSLLASAAGGLSPRERIEFLNNALALLQGGELGGDAFLRALSAFSDDPQPLVMASLLDVLDRIRESLIPPETEPQFAAYVRRTLGPALTRVGMERRPGEDETASLIRPRLIDWLANRGDDETVMRFAREQAAAYLGNPDSVDPALVTAVLRATARNGDRALFDEYRRRFETARIPADRARFLAALGAFHDPALQDSALAYVLSGPLRPNELFTVGRAMEDTPEGQDRVFRWITENYDALMSRLPQEFGGFLPYFAEGCSQQRLEAARAFFDRPEHQGPGTEKQLARVADMVSDCVSLREREGEAVSRYLEDTAGRP